MSLSSKSARELVGLGKLAFPIIVAQLAQSMMSMVDTYLVAPLGSEAIGGTGLGGNYFFGTVFTIGGVLLCLDTLVSQAVGRGDHDDAAKNMAQALYLGGVLCVLSTLALWFAIEHIEWFEVSPSVVPLARAYVYQTMWGIPATLFAFGASKFLQAHGSATAVMLIAIFANVFNYFADLAFIYGRWGAPEMGVAGAGFATSAGRWLMALAYAGVIVWGRFPFKRAHWRPDWDRLKLMLRIGVPAALQIGLEIGVFVLAGILISRFEPASLAAHYILLQIASFTFMVPLGISAAASVRVGHAIGEAQPAEAAFRGKFAIAVSAVFMALSAGGLLVFGRDLAGLFHAQEAAVVAFLTILGSAAAFQVFDGIQVTATGALRGLGDTRSAFLANLFGHWLIAFPLALFLGFDRGMEARGVWLALAVGLVVVALVLLAVWRLRAREILLQTSGRDTLKM